jgi:hypothetical protein
LLFVIILYLSGLDVERAQIILLGGRLGLHITQRTTVTHGNTEDSAVVFIG